MKVGNAHLNGTTLALLKYDSTAVMSSLDGLTVGILDIAKARGDVFLKRLGERLGERGIAFKHYAKPTNTRPAPLPLAQQIATEVDVVIEGLSD